MAENAAPAPAKKGKLKLIIMLVVVIILAIGLSIAGTLWFLGGGLPGSSDEEASAAATGETAFVASTYVNIDDALVTTIQATGRQRYAQVLVSLEARDPAALAAAQVHMPLIQSELITVLSGSDFMKLQTPAGRKELAVQMLTRVNQVLEQEGAPSITGVLFRNFVVQ